MKYLLDETRKDLEIVNRRFEDLAHGSLMYHFNELFTQENYLGGILKQHQEDLCALESRAREMDFFESGYDKAMDCASPVNNRADTVEFWQYVINSAQAIFDVEESCQTVVKRWNGSQHSYCDI
jgi:hypothetical protein